MCKSSSTAICSKQMKSMHRVCHHDRLTATNERASIRTDIPFDGETNKRARCNISQSEACYRNSVLLSRSSVREVWAWLHVPGVHQSAVHHPRFFFLRHRSLQCCTGWRLKSEYQRICHIAEQSIRFWTQISKAEMTVANQLWAKYNMQRSFSYVVVLLSTLLSCSVASCILCS